MTLTGSCAATASDGTEAVNGISDAGSCADNDDESWQSSGDTVTGVSSNDITLSVDIAMSPADTNSNGASTLSASDTNGTSTTSAGDGLIGDGSFNGFIVAMHRKMVHSHVELSVCHRSVYVCSLH